MPLCITHLVCGVVAYTWARKMYAIRMGFDLKTGSGTLNSGHTRALSVPKFFSILANQSTVEQSWISLSPVRSGFI